MSGTDFSAFVLLFIGVCAAGMLIGSGIRGLLEERKRKRDARMVERIRYELSKGDRS